MTDNNNSNNESEEQVTMRTTPENLSKNKKPSLQLVPNPNDGTFKAVINNDDNPRGQLFVYNLTGRLIYSQLVEQNEIALNLQLEKGMYVIHWMNETNTESKKMIVR